MTLVRVCCVLSCGLTPHLANLLISSLFTSTDDYDDDHNLLPWSGEVTSGQTPGALLRNGLCHFTHRWRIWQTLCHWLETKTCFQVGGRRYLNFVNSAEPVSPEEFDQVG